MENAEALGEKADGIRRSVVAVAVRNGASHIAPSLSCVDILVALYWRVMAFDPSRPQWKDRDRLVLSKGHGAYALYAILADLGVFPAQEWEKYNTPESTLCGCIERRPEFGIEAGCGSLGHGLPMAVGLAFGARLQGLTYHTFCLVGDGELQEGTTWEAIQFAVKHELSNLTIVVDRNRLQAMDTIANVLDRSEHDLERRLSGFGLNPVTAGGHDLPALVRILTESKNRTQVLPAAVVAETVKGYGLKCMENVPGFHYRIPTPEELEEGWSAT
jgi:transketolase